MLAYYIAMFVAAIAGCTIIVNCAVKHASREFEDNGD